MKSVLVCPCLSLSLSPRIGILAVTDVNLKSQQQSLTELLGRKPNHGTQSPLKGTIEVGETFHLASAVEDRKGRPRPRKYARKLRGQPKRQEENVCSPP